MNASSPTLLLTAAGEKVVAGEIVVVRVNALNEGDAELAWTFPDELPVQLATRDSVSRMTLLLDTNAVTQSRALSPGTFARAIYHLRIPATATGETKLELNGHGRAVLMLDVAPAITPHERKRSFSQFLKEGEPLEPGKPFDPGRFFKQHIAPHDPMYFIIGSEAPTGKFQISFKYQLLNEEGRLATNHPALKGFHIGYTQTSLWDLGAPSAPFFDTSYKPALLYDFKPLARGETNDWFRLDLQAGIQHESNGKSGADSRSLNISYLRPSLVLGRDDSIQLTLQPRVWAYLDDLSDNRDLDEYRGHLDMRVVLGWRRGLQLSALGRMGTEGQNHSVQFDMTLPLMSVSDSFSVYLHAQYYTGYGESLLRYNERTDVFRIGLALYR